MRSLRPIAIIFASSLLGALILLVLMHPSMRLPGRNQGIIVLASILIALLALPIVHSFLKLKKLDLFQPPVMLSVYVFLGYVWPIPGFLEGTDEFSRSWGRSYSNLEAALSTALVAVILGVTAFYIGFYYVGKWVQPRARTSAQVASEVFSFDRRRLLSVGVIYSLAALALFGLGVYLLGGLDVLLHGLGDRIRLFAGLNYFIHSINLLIVVSLIWWVFLLVQRRVGKISFWIYTLVAATICTLQGSKSVIFIFILTGTILYHLLYRRIAAWKVLVGSVGVLSLLAGLGLILRQYFVVGYFTTLDPVYTFNSLLEAIRSDFGGNFIQVQVLTILVDRVPGELPFQYGKTYLSLFTMVVPRALWPDKLLPSAGVFTLAFWPKSWLDWGTTIPPGLMGEMYMNFGMAGVFFGMLAFGVLFAYAVGYVRQNRTQVKGVIFYALLVGMLPIYLRGEFVAPTVLFAILALPTLFALWLVYRRRPQAALMPGRLQHTNSAQGRKPGANNFSPLLHL